MIVPVFDCEDTHAATAFYVDVLGFNILSRFQLDPDVPDPAYVTMNRNGSHLHLSSFPGDKGSGKLAYLYCDEPEEVDAIYKQVTAHKGVDIRIPLQDQAWGLREFGFVDPFGNVLRVGAQLAGELPTGPAH